MKRAAKILRERKDKSEQSMQIAKRYIINENSTQNNESPQFASNSSVSLSPGNTNDRYQRRPNFSFQNVAGGRFSKNSEVNKELKIHYSPQPLLYDPVKAGQGFGMVNAEKSFDNRSISDYVHTMDDIVKSQERIIEAEENHENDHM